MPILIVTLVLYLPSTPEIQTPRPDPMRVLEECWVPRSVLEMC